MLICRNAAGATWSGKGWEPLSIEIFCKRHSKKTCAEPKQKYSINIISHKYARNRPYSQNFGAPQNRGQALGLSIFSLMVNPRLVAVKKHES